MSIEQRPESPPPKTLTASYPVPSGNSGGFVQTFGLDYRVAILAVLIDFMAFGGDIISMGLLYPVELGSAAVLTIITYKIQKSWYGDNHDSALIKALIIGLLTAIPVPISGFVAGPGGLLGIIHSLRGKR